MRRKLLIFVVLTMVVSILLCSVLNTRSVFTVNAGYYDIGGVYIRNGKELEDWEAYITSLKKQDPVYIKNYKKEDKAYRRNIILEQKLADYKEKHKFDQLTKAKSEKTKEILKAASSSLTTVFQTLKDASDGGDFSTASLVNNIFDSAAAIANCCGPWGAVVGAVFNIGREAYNQFMGGKEPTSEIAQFEARLNEKFDELNKQLVEIEGQISTLSDDINKSADRTIAEITAAIDKTVASEHIREFQTRGTGNFSYKEFRNYLYGNDNATKAYCNFLKEIQRARMSSDNRNGYTAEDEKHYYDLIFEVLYENTEIFYDYMLPTDGKSIIQEYYDVLLAKDGIEIDEAQFQAICYAYDLYQSALTADEQLMSCGTYQYLYIYREWFATQLATQNDFSVYDFDDDSLSLKYKYNAEDYFSLHQINALFDDISKREDELIIQLAKDLIYILSPEDSYITDIAEKLNDFSEENSYETEIAGELYEMTDCGNGNFGSVSPGQKLYMTMLPESLFDIFGDFDRENFYYESVNACVEETSVKGVFNVKSIGDFVIDLYYKNSYAEETVSPTKLCSIAFFSKYQNDTSFDGGDGSEYAPYLISNKEQFKAIGDDLSKHYRLIKDINFDGETITPFGYRYDNESGYEFYDEFTGSFDGNYHTISKLNVNGYNYLGLFCKLGESADVENLRIDGINVETLYGENYKSIASPPSAQFYAGIITGVNNGNITNCKISSSSIKFALNNLFKDETDTLIDVFVGGVVGQNNSLISSCSISANITADLKHDFSGNTTKGNKINVYAGGICGINEKAIGYCFVQDDTVVNSEATARFSPKDTVNPYIGAYAGRCVGGNNGTISAVSVQSNAKSSAKGDIEVYSSRYGKHYGNRSQSPDNINIGTDKDAAIGEINEGVLINLLSKLEKPKYRFKWEYEELQIDGYNPYEYDVTEKRFHTKGLKVYYESEGEKVYSDKFSIINAYGFNPYNIQLTEDKQDVVLLLLVNVNGVDYFGLITIPVTIKQNELNITVNNVSKTWNQYLSYSFKGMVIEWDYAVGKDKSDTIDIDNQKDIRVEGTFCGTDNKIREITEIKTDKIGKYIIDIYYKNELVAEDYEINIVCSNSLYIIDESSGKYVINTYDFEKDDESSISATCISNGEAHYVCKDCRESGVEHIVIVTTPKISEHSFILLEREEASCSSTGLIVEECEHCHYYRKTIIPKLAHNYVLNESDKTKHVCKLCGDEENHQYVVSESYEDGVLTYHYHCVSEDCQHESEVPDTNIKPDSADKIPVVYVSDAYALNYGDTVKVYIQLKNNPGVSGAVFGVRYDKRLIFIEKEEGEFFANSLSAESQNNDEVNYGFNFIWTKTSTSEIDGNIMILTFRLPESIKEDEDDVFKVEVTYGYIPQALSGMTDCGFLCEDGNMYKFYAKTGYIRIVDHLPGDINNDGKVDLFDALLVSRSLIDGTTAVDWRYGDVDVSGSSIDSVSGTIKSAIQIQDAQRIMQSLVGTESLISTYFDVVLNPNCDDLKISKISVNLYEEYDEEKRVFPSGVYTDLPVLSREGYVFLGWFTRFEGGVQVQNGDIVKYNQSQWVQTLYAHWKINTVTFYDSYDSEEELDIKSYSGKDIDLKIIDTVDIAVDILVKETVDKSFFGLNVRKKLEYWEDENHNKYGAEYNSVDLKNGSVELYAVWKYTLYLNGEETSLGNLKIIKSSNQKGYKISNLYSDSDRNPESKINRISDLFNCKLQSERLKAYAEIEPIKYTIIYKKNVNNEDEDHTETERGIENAQPLYSGFSRTGYSFLGWSLDSNSTKADTRFEYLQNQGECKEVGYFDEISYNVDKKIFETTLYAIWKANNYKLSHELSFGCVSWYSDSERTISITEADYGSSVYYSVTANEGYSAPNDGDLELNEANFTLDNATAIAIANTIDDCSPNTYEIKFDNSQGGLLTNVYMSDNRSQTLGVEYDGETREYKLTAYSTDSYCTIGQEVYLFADREYYVHMNPSFSESNGKLQLFYAIGSYSENQSLCFSEEKTQTFTPKQTGKYSIRFDIDDCEMATVKDFWISDVPSSIKAQFGAEIEIADNVLNTYQPSNYWDQDGKLTKVPTDGIIFYKPTEEAVITFDQNGGAGGTESAQVTYSQNGYSNVSINEPTKAGCIFVGYYANSGDVGSGILYWLPGQTKIAVRENIKLIAHWVENCSDYTLRKEGEGSQKRVEKNYVADHDISANNDDKWTGAEGCAAPSYSADQINELKKAGYKYFIIDVDIDVQERYEEDWCWVWIAVRYHNNTDNKIEFQGDVNIYKIGVDSILRYYSKSPKTWVPNESGKIPNLHLVTQGVSMDYFNTAGNGIGLNYGATGNGKNSYYVGETKIYFIPSKTIGSSKVIAGNMTDGKIEKQYNLSETWFTDAHDSSGKKYVFVR